MAQQSDWLIQIPFTELAALQALPSRMEKLEKQNAQLLRELEGLRGMFNEVMQQFGDLKQGLKPGRK